MNDIDKSTQNILKDCGLQQFEAICTNAMLSDTDIQILLMFYRGIGISLIAERMNFSVRTIKSRKARALRKISKTI